MQRKVGILTPMLTMWFMAMAVGVTLLGGGQRLEGKITGLETFPLKVGNQSLRMDLASAL